MKIIENVFDSYLITTDKNKMDLVAIHEFLTNYSGWSNNISLDKVKISIENSLNLVYSITTNKLVMQGSYQTSQQLLIWGMYMFWIAIDERGFQKI